MASTWTRTVAAPIAAAVAGMLIAAGGAQAASGTLSVSTARALAHKLEAKQRKQRSLVFTELGKPARRSATRIDFPYRDRSTRNVLCTGRIVVKQSGSHRSAELVDPSCHGIPSEILAFERATRHLRSAVTGAAPDVRASLERYDSSLSRCDDLVVPRDRRADVDLLLRAGGVAAFYRPLRATLDDFDTALHDVNGFDPTMVSGVKAWDKTLVLRDSLPAAANHACRAVRDWAANGFSKDTAPADFDRLAIVMRDFGPQYARLDEVVRYLHRQGAVKKVAAVFSPRGILALIDKSRSL